MTDLLMPKTGPRIPPLQKEFVDPYVRTEYDKSIHTWGIPNNLIKTMAWLPRLALTEVDYANSFIFDNGSYSNWPDPSGTGTIMYPLAGFVDRVTKELVINTVSLLNRSRYSITHHTVIGYTTLKSELQPKHHDQKEDIAEALLLHLVDANGKPDYRNKKDGSGKPLYSDYQLQALDFAVTIHRDAHEVTDAQFQALEIEARKVAINQIKNSPIASNGASRKFLDAYVRGMLVELSWCICHFNGLLNNWFTVLKVMDEADKDKDEIDFVSYYNSVVPEKIKVRNNGLLRQSGWGS